MPSSLSPTGHRQLFAAAEEAVSTAAFRQWDQLRFHLQEQPRSTLEECREVLEDWQPDECLLLDLSLDERLELLEDQGSDDGHDLGPVTLATLRDRIDGLAGLIVGALGTARALSALEAAEDLLESYDLPVEALLPHNPYGCFRHYGERQEDQWSVLEYRNVEGNHFDLFQREVHGITLVVRRQLARGSRSPPEEDWDAT